MMINSNEIHKVYLKSDIRMIILLDSDETSRKRLMLGWYIITHSGISRLFQYWKLGSQ